MPLVSCIECGHQVSTMAANCPGCGAPVTVIANPRPALDVTPRPSWKRLGGLALGTLVVGGAAIFLVLANAPTERIANSYSNPHQAVEAPIAPVASAPTHHYVAIVRGYFGYSPRLSDNDRANGLASKPLTLVDYRGKRGAEYTFSVSDGGPYVDVVTCVEPCAYAQTIGMGGSKVLPVQPGTILGDIVDDARSGMLDVPRTGQQ